MACLWLIFHKFSIILNKHFMPVQAILFRNLAIIPLLLQIALF
jgi:hypothetical protein